MASLHRKVRASRTCPACVIDEERTMKRATKGKATKTYARGKRVSIYVKEGEGHAKSIGMITAIFWETDGMYLYYRESYQGKTLKIRWEEIDNVIPVAQRSKVGVAIKGEDVRSQKVREISEEADRGHEINATAPITITKPTRRKLSVDEVVFMLGELRDGTSVSDIRDVLEVHDGSVRAWKKRLDQPLPPDRETGWFKRHVDNEIGAWFDTLWSEPDVPEPEQQVYRTPMARQYQTDVDPLIAALESRIVAAQATLEQKVGEYVANGREIEELARLRSVIDAEITALKRNLAHYTLMLKSERDIQSGTQESDDNGTS